MIQLFYSNVIKISRVPSPPSNDYYIALLNTHNRVRIQPVLAQFLQTAPNPFSQNDFQEYLCCIYDEWLASDEALDIILSNLVAPGLVSTTANTHSQHMIAPHVNRIHINGLGFDIILLQKKIHALEKVRLDFAFYRNIAFWIVTTALGALFSCYFWGPKQISSSLFFPYLLTCLGCTVHELGHICACNMVGVKINGLGVGVYLSFLRLFVNIDAEIWEQTRSKRILIDIAGVYFQLIFIAFLAIFSFLFPPLRSGIYSNLFLIALNLCPIFRFDGYWVLADALNTSDIWHYYKQHIKSCRRAHKPTKRAILLTAYFMASVLTTFGIIAQLFPRIILLPYFISYLRIAIINFACGTYPLHLWPVVFSQVLRACFNIIICIVPYMLIFVGIVNFLCKHRKKQNRKDNHCD